MAELGAIATHHSHWHTLTPWPWSCLQIATTKKKNEKKNDSPPRRNYVFCASETNWWLWIANANTHSNPNYPAKQSQRYANITINTQNCASGIGKDQGNNQRSSLRTASIDYYTKIVDLLQTPLSIHESKLNKCMRCDVKMHGILSKIKQLPAAVLDCILAPRVHPSLELDGKKKQ